ncbi:MAG: hypothetical protein J6N56_07385 [Bacteroidales bacterium]|nr:hypothetical protein [Bacteroidales bacterium]
MQDKLQQLTEKLYNEGLSKGKEDAAKMLEDARNESERIIAEAQQQKKEILAQADKECSQLKEMAQSDIKTASRQALTQIRQDIEKAVKMEVVSSPVKEALSSSEFMQSLITTVVSAFSPDKESSPLEVILPQGKKAELESFVKDSLARKFDGGLDVTFSKEISGGLKVSRKGSGYFIDFTDNAFEQIISEYLRPKTRKLIFGE